VAKDLVTTVDGMRICQTYLDDEQTERFFEHKVWEIQQLKEAPLKAGWTIPLQVNLRYPHLGLPQ
jgi:hypothetical protein